MAGEWKKFQLGQIGSVVTGRTPPGTLPEYFGDAVPFVTPSDMDGRRKVHETARSLSVQGSEILKRVIVQRGVAVSCIGWQMGKAVLIDMPAATNQQINTLVPEPKLADDLFVYYALTSERDAIFRLGAGGSRTPILNKSGFEAFEITLPPLAEQKAIAAVLGALDDKIELNRRMNATLEAMARALFQSWFVDFDPVRAKLDGRKPIGLDETTAALFPDSFQESSLGHIPTGWDVCPLSEKIQLLSGGTPKTSEPTYWNGDIPWYSVRDAPSETDVWVIHTDKHVTKLGIANSAAQVFPEKTTIISARGTVGKLALTAVPMAMNQSCYGVRGITGYGDYFTYYSLREATAQLQQRTHGTVFDTITTETFQTLDCIFPTPKITAAFDKLVEPLLDQIRENLHQSRTLATMRDTLLPKLLSGELCVAATLTSTMERST